MILYLAGPYRGNIEVNIDRARKVAIELWEAGFTVITPHLNTAHFEMDCACPEEAYLQGDLDILARCDAIVMLEAWLDSEGAKREHAHALKLGIPVYYWPDYPPINSEPNRERYPLHAFTTQVAKRLEHGAREYGAESYLTDNVTRQIEEELLDIAGWASLGWAKLKRVEELWRELRELVGSEEG